MKSILSKSKAYLLVALFILGLFYFFSKENSKLSIYNRQNVKSESPATTTVDVEAPGPRSVSSIPVAENISPDEKIERVEKFNQWFNTEAKSLDYLNTDPDAKEIELKERAAQYTKVERDLLFEKAKGSPKLNETVLATYLLGLTGDRKAMMALVKQPITGEEGTPHDMNEILRTQERAKAITTINKLLESQDPKDMVELQQLAHEITDPVVKKYLHSKLNEHSGL